MTGYHTIPRCEHDRADAPQARQRASQSRITPAELLARLRPTTKPRVERFKGKHSARKRRQLARMIEEANYPRPDGLWMAVDPSANATGWAVFTADGAMTTAGTFRPSSAKSAPNRFSQLARHIERWCERDGDGVPPVQLVILETSECPSYNRAGGIGVKGAVIFGTACGVVHGAAAACGATVVRVDVRQWKGNAKKQTEQGQDHNEADAIALGRWYWSRINSGNAAKEQS